MKAFIINFNRLELMTKVANWCHSHGLEVIIIDNNSDSPMLIQYYAELCPYEVIRMGGNYGHTVIWDKELNILNHTAKNERYIVTDPDLGLSGVPDDFLTVMNNGLDMFPDIDKCGLSLEINDLPDSKEGNFIRVHEAKYWQKPIITKAGTFYNAAVDTTFALYREGVRHYSHSAVRTPRPYTAKHLPWYYTDVNLLSEDEQYYYKTASSEFASGKNRLI